MDNKGYQKKQLLSLTEQQIYNFFESPELSFFYSEFLQTAQVSVHSMHDIAESDRDSEDIRPSVVLRMPSNHQNSTPILDICPETKNSLGLLHDMIFIMQAYKDYSDQLNYPYVPACTDVFFPYVVESAIFYLEKADLYIERITTKSSFRACLEGFSRHPNDANQYLAKEFMQRAFFPCTFN